MLIGGSAFIPVGAVVFFMLTPGSSPVAAATGSLVMGFGTGVSSVAFIILIQEIVTASQRGIGTASNLFSRNLGSTLGATTFGAVLNYGLSHAAGIGVITSDELRHVLESAHTSTGSDTAVRLALQLSGLGLLAQLKSGRWRVDDRCLSLPWSLRHLLSRLAPRGCGSRQVPTCRSSSVPDCCREIHVDSSASGRNTLCVRADDGYDTLRGGHDALCAGLRRCARRRCRGQIS